MDPECFISNPDLTFHSMRSLTATPTLKIIILAVQNEDGKASVRWLGRGGGARIAGHN